MYFLASVISRNNLMLLTQRQVQRCTTIAHQLAAYYADNSNPFRDLLTNDLITAVERVTVDYPLSEPPVQPYLSTWAHDKRQLNTTIQEFRRLIAKLPVVSPAHTPAHLFPFCGALHFRRRDLSISLWAKSAGFPRCLGRCCWL